MSTARIDDAYFAPVAAAEGYESAPEYEPKTLAEYFEVLRRRRTAIVLTALLIAASAGAVGMLLPAKYRSTATVLIQDQEIPQDLIRTTVTTAAEERIQVISQQVMTRAVLLGIVDKYDLYAGNRASMTNEEVVERMRRDIRLTTISADLQERKGNRRETSATIAFRISYDSRSAESSQRVVNELVSLYLSENVKARQQRAAETSAFLTEEADRLSAQISEMEAKLADFKSRNLTALPQTTQIHLTAIDRAEADVMRIDRELATLEERRAYAASQLAQIKDLTPLPTMPLQDRMATDAGERLRVLQNQYASLSGLYSASHPDVRRLAREIEALSKDAGTPPPTAESMHELEVVRGKLQALREKYAENHPDVQRQARAVAALEQSISVRANAEAARPTTKTAQERAETQLAITLQGQVATAQGEIKSLRQARAELKAKIAQLERRVERSPAVERDYLDLLRNHENATVRYRELKAKQMQAEVAESLEKDRKAERFSLIDPPEVPERPVSPNRPAILAIGLILALGGGLGMGAVREALDGSIRGERDLLRFSRVPLLGAIPYVQTAAERRGRRQAKSLALVALLVAIGVAVAFVHLFIYPLPVLWYVLTRRLGLE